MPDYAETDESKANFVLLQARYALQLKNKLTDGTITQDYYDNNIWLTQQQLENAWPGISGEFFQAVDNGDYGWLARKVNKSYEYVTTYLQDVIKKGASAAGVVAGTTIKDVASGVAAGAASNLGFAGWTAVLLVLGVIGLFFYAKVKA